MVLLPTFIELAETLNVAVAMPLEPDRLAAPSKVLPSEKETEPVGVVFPLPALTVAVSVVPPPTTMVVGLAVTLVVVATAGTVTATVTDPEDAPKLVLPP